MAFEKLPLSESPFDTGRRIKLDSSNTLIHTADASALDEIHLNLVGTSTLTVQVTISFGGTTNPDDLIFRDVPPRGAGMIWVIEGDLLTGGVTLQALGATADVVTAGGYVIRDTGS